MYEVKTLTRLLGDGREVIELLLVSDSGLVHESVLLHVRDGRVVLPSCYAPTRAGALDYGRVLWGHCLPPEQRLF